ncbi:MAG TPA: ketoacyl-ACP synthase III family protein [Micromonosporaceae bacterium]|nr:ketoacyl-ACP synthase III family protein [Micromonosporaceae bacterium]
MESLGLSRPDHPAELFVAGIGAWLPAAVPVEEVIRQGICDEQTVRRSEMLGVTVDGTDEVPAEMAVRAARAALAQAGYGARDVAVVLHAYLFDQGNDLWSPAGYVQRRTLGGQCPAIGIQQVSNGGMAALDVARAYLRARPGAQAALVTTADRFCLPGFDRWHSDPGTVYADGGTALVLSKVDGFARLLALELVSGPELEGMHRAGPALGVGRRVLDRPVSLGAHKRAFVEQLGNGAAMERIVSGQRAAMDAALAAAGTKLSEIDWFVLPHFGVRRLQSNYLRHLEVAVERTNWEFSRTVGHLGAGDQIASLAHLLRTGALRPGQRCMLMAVGAGFTWSCGVIEVTRTPYW